MNSSRHWFFTIYSKREGGGIAVKVGTEEVSERDRVNVVYLKITVALSEGMV